MKKITTVMASAMLMGASMTAGALSPPLPAPPYAPNKFIAGGVEPNLFLSEKTAYALLEGVQQAAEAAVYARSCDFAKGKWDLDVSVEDGGNGTLLLSSNGLDAGALRGVGQNFNNVSPGGSRVLVGGLINFGKGYTVTPFSGTTWFNKTGSVMVGEGTMPTRSINGGVDALSGTVIKDFFQTRGPGYPLFWDWGLQSVSKNKFPQDKWWQRSLSNRSDGVFARTQFRKDRIYSGKKGGACVIEIDINGTNDADLFEQSGTLVIRKP